MKSSLKFTVIALLLGSVLDVQSLAASSVVTLETLSELSNSSGRFANPTEGPKAFADCIAQLVEQGTDHPSLKERLKGEILRSSSLSPSFFEEARKVAKANVKGLMSFGEGVVLGRTSSKEERDGIIEQITLLQVSGDKKINELTEQIILLQDEVNELSEEIDPLQREVNNLSAQLESPEVRAFARLSDQSVVVPAETLPAYTVIKPDTSKLSVAEQVFLLKVRSKLTLRDELTTSLTDLETLLRACQMIAITNPTSENLERAAFLVNVIPQVRAIAPIIGRYLQSITGDILKTNAAATSSGWFGSLQFTALQTLQLKELEARKNLAYATFDALFGTMVKPSTVPSAVDFRVNPSAANVLIGQVHTAHATLPVTIPPQKLIVKNDGLISVIGDEDYATEMNLTLPFMVDIQQLTVDFLKQTYGAQTLLQSTLKTSAVIGETDLAQAKTILCPPPVEDDLEDDSVHSTTNELVFNEEKEVATSTNEVVSAVLNENDASKEEV